MRMQRIGVAAAVATLGLAAWLLPARTPEPSTAPAGSAVEAPAAGTAGPAARMAGTAAATAPAAAPGPGSEAPYAAAVLPGGGAAELSADRARVLVEEIFHVSLRLAKPDGSAHVGAQPYVVLRHSSGGDAWTSALVETPPGSGVYTAPFFPDARTRTPGTLTVSLLPGAAGDPALPARIGPTIRLQTGVPTRLRERALAQRAEDGGLRVRVDAVGDAGPVRVRASLYGDGASLAAPSIAYGDGWAELVFPPRADWPERLELRDVDLVAGTPPRSVDRVASLPVHRADRPPAATSPAEAGRR